MSGRLRPPARIAHFISLLSLDHTPHNFVREGWAALAFVLVIAHATTLAKVEATRTPLQTVSVTSTPVVAKTRHY